MTEDLAAAADQVDGGASEPASSSGPPAIDRSTFGKPEAELTHVVDAVAVIDRKRASMLAHTSQIGPDHFMAAMAPEAFAHVFGTEWFIVEPPIGPEAPPLFTELFQPTG